MKTRTLIVGGCAVFLVWAVCLTAAYADYGGDKTKRAGGLEQKFSMMAHCIVSQGEELGLSEEKTAAVKNLKLETKKQLIQQNAQIEIVALDLKAKLHEKPVNVQAVNALVEQSYDLQKAKDKALVEAIAKLDGMLTKDQTEKLHKLWKTCAKGADSRCGSCESKGMCGRKGTCGTR